MKLYVGNLPWSVDDSDLSNLFESVGPVTSATVVMDRDTGRSRGFGFVEMAEHDGLRAAEELNGQNVDGRAIRVNEAQSKSR